jgi:6-pyruvoyltetrahydropterin/6-carboxytetrahydropterin synthase
MFTLTKEFKFEAAHQLMNHDGKCARLHGHSWKGRIIVKGEHLIGCGPKTNMLMDFSELSSYVKPLVEDFLDHHYLNDTLNENSPTSEFVAKWIYEKLISDFPGLRLRLKAVEIDETCTSSCRYEH